MSFHNYLWPMGRLAVIGATVAALGAGGPAWAHDPDEGEDKSDQDRKESKVYRWEGKDDDEGGPRVYELRDDDGKVKAFQYKVERADAKGGYLGVQVQDVTRAMMKARNLPNDEGALVNRVEDEGPADDAGLRRGDVIVELEGQEIEDADELIRVMRDLEPGKKVDVVVLREGNRRTFAVELGQRPHDTMVMGPGYRWRGEMPDMEELRKQMREMKEIDPERFRPYMRQMEGERSAMRAEVEELRKELSELRDELRELRQELRDARDRSGSRSDD